jgi:hypothetical protein
VSGDGFIIRHAFATENTWYNPGWWHTAEDYYRLDGAETGGALVRAVGDGEIVFAGSDYPGRVIIVRHAGDLFSMYGHLDFALSRDGGTVARGEVLGTVLTQAGGRAPSHLHFEMRQFLTTPEVNGAAPRYGYGCGVHCPPGPGYWPIDAPEHPVAMGWRNPLHALFASLAGEVPEGTQVIVAEGAPGTLPVYTAADDDEPRGELPARPGASFPLLAVAAGAPDGEGTGADAYRVRFSVQGPEGDAWLPAVIPDAGDTGSDGRPSSLRFALLVDDRE